MADLEGRLRYVRIVLLVFFSGLLLLMVLVPFTEPAGSIDDLSGKIGVVDNAQRTAEMNPVAGAVYGFGDVNCHQMAARSYYLNDNQLPICSRDLGIFIGIVVGLAITVVVNFRPRFYMVVLLALPMALDGGIQAITDYESNNLLRTATGLLAGIALAFFLVIIAREVLLPDRKKAVEG
jgi:uncharacterized membrane protein